MPSETFPKRLAIGQRQFELLRALLAEIIPTNAFYRAKLEEAGVSRKVISMGDFRAQFPFTTKQELVEDQRAHPPYGTNLTYPLERYTRCHQTSGTAGSPLRWLDTQESWQWMSTSWERVYQAAGVGATDRVFFAFSFGPFLGFWLAFETATRLGCLCLPGGGMTSATRLQTIFDHGVTVLCCTPTYAIHLAEVAQAQKVDLRSSPVRKILVAGEPGGSVSSVRARLEKLWPGARVFDHHGMTEVGPVTFGCPVRPGVLHVMENAFVAEVIHPATGTALEPGEIGELVLTNLGRTGSPLFRYRTGDLVRVSLETACECGRSELALEGGILGRTDDMVVIRGVNVYPSAVDEIIRATGEVAEYQMRVTTGPALAGMSLQIEPGPECADRSGLAERLEQSLQTALSLRVPVTVVDPGQLPRFELKAKRWVHEK